MYFRAVCFAKFSAPSGFTTHYLQLDAFVNQFLNIISQRPVLYILCHAEGLVDHIFCRDGQSCETSWKAYRIVLWLSPPNFWYSLTLGSSSLAMAKKPINGNLIWELHSYMRILHSHVWLSMITLYSCFLYPAVSTLDLCFTLGLFKR